MASDYNLQLNGTTALRTIDGIPHSIWSYLLSWQEQPSSRRIPVDPGPRLAIVFSARLGIRNPKDLPDVAEIQDTLLDKPPTGDIQRIYRDTQGRVGNTLLFRFVAPSALDTFAPVRVAAQSPLSSPWIDLPFKVLPADTAAYQQVISAPAMVCPAPVSPPPPSPIGKPLNAFAGTLPYASEIFGVYQPLAGWLGARSSHRFSGFSKGARLGAASTAAALTQASTTPVGPGGLEGASQGVLSPVGLVTLFREYFFEFDNFLGSPSGHLWISPGGTVEVVESSTRRTLTEQTASQSEDSTSKVEENSHQSG